ncbi:MAG: nitrogen fixation protein [Rhodospirillales bacterium]|nr:nitrogen fixation protein [Rhodospirillales bacterium]
MSEPDHLRIAITTDDLLQVDANFLDARQFVFYGLTPQKALFLDCVQFKDLQRAGAGAGAGGGKKGGGRCCAAGAPAPAIGNSIDARIAALAGSSVLFTLAMSDPEAVRVADLGIFPVKLGSTRSIYEVLDRLQEMMKGSPPLWLRRVVRSGPMIVAA